jgi:hypothetical protein
MEMGEVHSLSLLILECLENERIEVNMALAAVALTLVRLASPIPVSQPDEVTRTQDVISFSQTLGGSVN